MDKPSVSNVVRTIVQTCNFISLGKIPRSKIENHIESEYLSVYDINNVFHQAAKLFCTTTKHV